MRAAGLRQAGFILIVALAFAAGILTLTMAGTTRSLAERLAVERFVAKQQAFYLAEAGVDRAIRWFATRTSPPQCPGAVITCTLDPFSGPQSLPSGSYRVLVDPDVNNPASGTKLYTVRVTGTAASVPVSRALNIIIRSESFARFGYFTNQEVFAPSAGAAAGAANWQTTGMVFEGPFHTNGQLNVAGSPLFRGPASTVDSTLNCSGGCQAPYGSSPSGSNPTFQQGLALGVRPIPLPNPSLNDLREVSSLNLRGNTTVSLAGSSIVVTNDGITRTYTVADHPVLFVDHGTLTVAGGELTGQLTMGSKGDVVIAGNVRYTCNPEDPQNDPDCLDAETGEVAHNTDLLGLIARNNIVISSSAPNALTVQASLTGVQGYLITQDWDTRDPTGTIHLYGGLITKYPPLNFQFTGFGTLLSGRLDSYSYDQRFRDTPPPYYPLTGRYEAVSWQDQGSVR